MKFFTSTNEAELTARNGNGPWVGNPEDVQLQWGNVVKHPAREEWAFGIHDSDEGCFRTCNPEAGESYTKAELQADGWEVN